MLERLLCKTPHQVFVRVNNTNTQIGTLDGYSKPMLGSQLLILSHVPTAAEFEHDFSLAGIPVDHETRGVNSSFKQINKVSTARRRETGDAATMSTVKSST